MDEEDFQSISPPVEFRRHPGGRKRVDIDYDEVESLMERGCNGVQVAAMFGIDEDTLYKRVKSDCSISFTELKQLMRMRGDARIHATQYEVAVDGKNVSMLQWLGKWRLDQKDDHAPLPPSHGKVGSGDSAMLSGTFKQLVADGMSFDEALSLINDVLTALPTKVLEFRQVLDNTTRVNTETVDDAGMDA